MTSDRIPSRSSIPMYDEAHAHQFKLAKDAVQAKICKIYNIPEAEKNMVAAQRQSLSRDIDKYLGGKKWAVKKVEAAKNSAIALNAEQSAALDATAQDIAMQFMEAFHLRSKAHAGKDKAPPPYRHVAGVDKITDIYVNHVTNESFSKIKSFGFNDFNAMALTGCIIYQAMLARDKIDLGMNYVLPSTYPEALRTEQDRAKAIDNIKHFWQKQRDDLQTAYRRDSDSHKGR